MKWSARRKAAIEYLKTIYRFNSEHGAFLIDVRLPDYSRAFSQWDSAWFEVREVDPGLVQYLKDCADDIPYGYPVEIVFSVSDPRNPQTEERIIRGVRNYFRYEIFVQRKRIRHLVRRGSWYCIVAICFLVAAATIDPLVPDGVLSATVNEGLAIGGWVFLWEAISQMFFQRGAIRRTISDYARFYEALFRFESS